MDHRAGEKKDQTERVLGLGRRTREERVKWNQMTALTFQTRGETSDIPGLPSGVMMMMTMMMMTMMIIQTDSRTEIQINVASFY